MQTLTNATPIAYGQELARQATRAAEFRGHRLGAWLWRSWDIRRTGVAICLDCQREAYIATHPGPNDIDISGKAVALNCMSDASK
jgi:hypothetical protein